jgi:hypothetical protein
LHSRTLQSEGTSHGADLDLPIYDLETIAAATEGFSAENKLGEGGYGPVYKVLKFQRQFIGSFEASENWNFSSCKQV